MKPVIHNTSITQKVMLDQDQNRPIKGPIYYYLFFVMDGGDVSPPISSGH